MDRPEERLALIELLVYRRKGNGTAARTYILNGLLWCGREGCGMRLSSNATGEHGRYACVRTGGC